MTSFQSGIRLAFDYPTIDFCKIPRYFFLRLKAKPSPVRLSRLSFRNTSARGKVRVFASTVLLSVVDSEQVAEYERCRIALGCRSALG